MQDLNDKVTGDSLTASEWSEVASEIQNVIGDSNIILNSSDLTQQLQSIYNIARKGLLFTDSGSQNLYTLTSAHSQPATEYSTGMTVVFNANSENNNASTVDVDGLGVRNIFEKYGTTVPIKNESVSGLTTLIYDGVNFSIFNKNKNYVYKNDSFVEFDNDLGDQVVGALTFDQFNKVILGDGGFETDIKATLFRVLTGNKVSISVIQNAGVDLFYNNFSAIETADRNSSSNLSSGKVNDCKGIKRSIGFNEIPNTDIKINYTMTRTDCGYMNLFTGLSTVTFTLDIDANLPEYYTTMIANIGTDNLLIVIPAASAVRFLDGSGSLVDGNNMTLATSGICTISKVSSLLYIIYGNGLTVTA